MDLLALGIGLGIGILLAGLTTYLVLMSRRVAKKEVERRFVSKEVFDQLQNQADLFRDDLLDKEQEIRQLEKSLAVKVEQVFHLEDQLNQQDTNLKKLQDHFKLEFENLANRLFEEKSQRFSSYNKQQMDDILSPLKEKIKSFEENIERKYLNETKDRISLKKEIEQLRDLNLQLSQDANNLASALKGDSKVQGDWGEVRLEMILQKAGLQKEIHYWRQPSFASHNGQQKRPDFIILLPGNKHLVIDSKVSLVAYEKYTSAEEITEKEEHLKLHLSSVRKHIKDLKQKNYQDLYQINSPDYLLMFIPIEPAFSLATREDNALFLDALEKNIVLVTSSTLLATMRTVSFIWKQERQKQNVQEIARQSGLLYDKFCGFVEDLQTIGVKLEHAQQAHHQAMSKLKDSRKYGDTLIGRAEKIRKLGARNSKKLPKGLLGE